MSTTVAGDLFPPPDVAEDLVPIARLGAGSKIVHEVLRNGRPKVITEQGVGVAVILDAATYEALRRDQAASDLLHDLRAAIAEADAGELIDHEDVMAELRRDLSSRAPPEVLRLLDGA